LPCPLVLHKLHNNFFCFCGSGGVRQEKLGTVAGQIGVLGAIVAAACFIAQVAIWLANMGKEVKLSRAPCEMTTPAAQGIQRKFTEILSCGARQKNLFTVLCDD
jgi:hypothetical protein